MCETDRKVAHRLTPLCQQGIWKETEIKLVEQIKQLELQLKGTVELNGNEARNLREKLKDALDSNVQLELQINAIINENKQLLSSNEELTIDVTRLRCEVEEYKKEIEDWGKKERDRIASVESSAVLQGKLSQLNTEVTKKQTEIVRLNGEVGRLRGELERIRLGSVVNHPSETFNITVNQLQSALALERDNTKEVLKEKDQVNKENLDLKRQVKELESIIKRRTKSGNLPICFEAPLSPQDLKIKESLEQKNRDLEHQLSRLQSQFASSQETIRELKLKYERDIHELEQQLKKVENENTSLKHTLEDNPPKSARKLNSTASSINAASVKEDAHLLATIRGLKMELSGREKEVMRLNKELEDTRKTNRRLQKEREKALNSAVKTRGSKDIDKHSLPRSLESSAVGKNYNPVLFEEDQETLMFLRAENKTLRDEIKRLEQDLISLHNKRIQDLSDLQQEHDVEMSRFLREHSAKHSTATVSHLQGQIYTQTMVINHLKQQIKELEKRAEEIPMLKAERDQLESTLIEANKKIARLHDLASPESMQYSGLLEKLEMVERRHEVREQKLQAIVRDLIARQSEAGLCGPTCRDKLMNKNREICYYRAEMDRILDTLAEFRWSK